MPDRTARQHEKPEDARGKQPRDPHEELRLDTAPLHTGERISRRHQENRFFNLEDGGFEKVITHHRDAQSEP